MKGKLYGIGVGPGDPELMTIKAVRKLEECEYIAVPGKNPRESVAYDIALKACPIIANKNKLPLTTPMTKDMAVLEAGYRQQADKIESILDQGMDVAFLTLGDPTIYSTYIYIHRVVASDGYDAVIINGVPSFCAVAARLGDSLVDRNEVLHIVPASYEVGDALNYEGTKVFMKSGSRINKVKEELINHGCNAKMVENCGMKDEKVYESPEDIPDDGGYYSLIVVR